MLTILMKLAKENDSKPVSFCANKLVKKICGKKIIDNWLI